MKKEINYLLEEILKLYKQSKQEKHIGTTSGMYIITNLESHKKQLQSLIKKSCAGNWESVYKGLLEQIGIVEEKKEGLTPKKIVTRRDEVVENNRRLQEQQERLQSWQQKNRKDRKHSITMETFEND